jgi:hypothetical protein
MIKYVGAITVGLSTQSATWIVHSLDYIMYLEHCCQYMNYSANQNIEGVQCIYFLCFLLSKAMDIFNYLFDRQLIHFTILLCIVVSCQLKQ